MAKVVPIEEAVKQGRWVPEIREAAE